MDIHIDPGESGINYKCTSLLACDRAAEIASAEDELADLNIRLILTDEIFKPSIGQSKRRKRSFISLPKLD